jgi:nucleotide-binding universal stress UspA family protein
MFTKILVPSDGSALSEKAVLAAVALAKQHGAELAGLTVLPEFHTLTLDPSQVEDTAVHFREARQADADRCLTSIAGAAQAAGVSCSTESVVSDAPWRAIVDCARARGCDLIVMASHGRHGIKAALLGSETQKVLVHTDIPVLVYR